MLGTLLVLCGLAASGLACPTSSLRTFNVTKFAGPWYETDRFTLRPSTAAIFRCLQYRFTPKSGSIITEIRQADSTKNHNISLAEDTSRTAGLLRSFGTRSINYTIVKTDYTGSALMHVCVRSGMGQWYFLSRTTTMAQAVQNDYNQTRIQNNGANLNRVIVQQNCGSLF